MKGRRHRLPRPDDLLSPDGPLTTALEAAAPGGVATRASDRLGYAHDASHYLITPRAVVTPRDTSQVAALLRACAILGQPLTFRSGGMSLSGQATNDGVLVDTRRNFRGIEVLDDGARVRVQPGATVRGSTPGWPATAESSAPIRHSHVTQY